MNVNTWAEALSALLSHFSDVCENHKPNGQCSPEHMQLIVLQLDQAKTVFIEQTKTKDISEKASQMPQS